MVRTVPDTELPFLAAEQVHGHVGARSAAEGGPTPPRGDNLPCSPGADVTRVHDMRPWAAGPPVVEHLHARIVLQFWPGSGLRLAGRPAHASVTFSSPEGPSPSLRFGVRNPSPRGFRCSVGW